jgi:glycosyltransferase involved in cell wall biosynthesis
VLSKADRGGGGASLIAETTAELLAAAGCPATHWVSWHGPTPAGRVRLLGGHWLNRVVRRLHWIARHAGLPDLVPWEYPLLRRRLAGCDVAHFHDISSAFSPLTVRWVARRMPTVWTFHDCSPFTGGCLYPFECVAFSRCCGRCPQLDRWPLGGRLRLDFTGRLQALKRATAAEGRFVPVAPSNWMADEALRSGMFAARPQVIPYPVDNATFRPRPRAEVRRELGLPPEGFWVLISAGSLADPRKGVPLAVEALRRCGRPVAALLVGRAAAGLRAELPGIACRAAGFVTQPAELARWYAAADVLLFPSLADNLPCTIQETMAAGTPTIGFCVGGVPDLVEHGVTGHLSPSSDVGGLTVGLQLAYDRPELLAGWADEGRRRAVARYGAHQYVQSHLDLYAELMRREDYVHRPDHANA